MRLPKVFGGKRHVVMGTATDMISGFAKELRDLTDWSQLTENEVFEQLYRYEPEIGGAIDRMSSLIARAYRGLYIEAGVQMDEKERRLLEKAQELEKVMKIQNWFELIAELLLIHGNAFIWVKKDKGIPKMVVLPNSATTIVDKKERINQFSIGTDVISEANYYVVNEGTYGTDQLVIPKDEILHFKYKDTPVFKKDKFGRMTYGVYSISPLERALMATKWKREVMLIDVLWRWRNVPREHHKISSEMFNLNYYTGSIPERRQKAYQDARQTLSRYVEELKSMNPDQAYVTTDNVEITVVEGKSRYSRPNELMDQISSYLWIAMGVPESIISGRSRGSYASELVISSYVAARALQLAEKIADGLLTVLRTVLRIVDGELPVEKLKMKVELVLETNRMEMFRQAAIMEQLGCFTMTEIRRLLGYEPLTEEQMSELIEWKGAGRRYESTTTKEVLEDVMRRNESKVAYPPTPHQEEKERSYRGDRI